MKRGFGRRWRSVDRRPEESAAPGGSVDNHPAEWPGLVRLTVQRSGNPPVSVWATVHRSRASRPGVPYRWTVTVKRRHGGAGDNELRSAHPLTHPPPALMALPGARSRRRAVSRLPPRFGGPSARRIGPSRRINGQPPSRMARSTPAHRPTIGESARFGLGHCPPFTRATCETPERSPRAVRQPPHTADRWPPAPVSLASQPEGMGPRGRITGRGSSQLPASCQGVCPVINEIVPRRAGHGPLIDLRLRSSECWHFTPNRTA